MGSKIEHKILKGVEYKLCTICNKYLPLNDFHKQKGSADGLRYYCKKCRKKIDMSPEKREKRLQYRKKHYQENAERLRNEALEYVDKNREVIAERRKERYYANHEESKAKIRKHYWNNRENNLESQKKYKKNNKEKMSILTAKRVARVKNLPNTLTLEEWGKCKEYFNHECAYCGRKVERLEKEHFIPVCKGGGFEKSNIVPSCRACNLSKHDKDIESWYPEQIFFSKRRLNKILKYFKIRI